MTTKIIDGVDLNGQRATNASDPSSSSDLATKAYVDNLVNGLSWHPECRVASTANVTVSNPGTSTFDGVTLSSGDRILLKNQSTGSQNGPWVFNGSGSALTRPVDFPAAGTPHPNSTFFVSEGTANADTAWTLTTNATITIDTTSLAFAQVGGGTAYSAGNGLQLVGSTFSVVPKSGGGITVDGTGVSVTRSIVPNYYSADIGDGSTTAITVTHNLSNSWPSYIVYEKSSKARVEISAVATDANTLTLTFPSAPSSAQYRITVIG